MLADFRRWVLALALAQSLGCALADDGSRRATTSAPADAAHAARTAPVGASAEPALPASCTGLVELARGERADAGSADGEQARERFQEAVTAYSRGEYAHALESFCELQRAVPAPALLFNVAVTCEKLGLDSDAAAFFEAFAAAEPSPMAAEALRRAAELRRATPR